jgi:hypothetical protein
MVLIYFLGYLIRTSVHVTKSGILNCTDSKNPKSAHFYRSFKYDLISSGNTPSET